MSTNVKLWSGLLCVLVVFACLSDAAWGGPSWFGSTSWFDWSDFRATAYGRVFIAKLESGSLRSNAGDVDLKNALGMSDHPEPFRELFVELYVDRLGLRWVLEQNREFRGTLDANSDAVSVLDLSTNRVGLDIDLIRFPYFRLGVNADYQADKPKLWDRRSSLGQNFVQYEGARPITVGLQARALPLRIREVPLTVESRVRFPVPLNKILGGHDETRITEFELAGGLRPAVWHTSVFGHSTFSASFEVGYRLTDMNMTMINNATYSSLVDAVVPSDVTLKARWSGVFFQVALFY